MKLFLDYNHERWNVVKRTSELGFLLGYLLGYHLSDGHAHLEGVFCLDDAP